jgi:hypothetical protein
MSDRNEMKRQPILAKKKALFLTNAPKLLLM